jgi:hypothetical protein
VNSAMLAAGLVIMNVGNGEIKNSYSTSDVTTTGADMGTDQMVSVAGGLVGLQAFGSTIEYCYATGSVSATLTGTPFVNAAGGIVAMNGMFPMSPDDPLQQGGSIRNSVAANSSVIANSTDVNRIVGTDVFGTYATNYALNTMTVESNGTPVSITDGESVAGTAKDLAILQSLAFYNTGSNWVTAAWDISNTTSVWKICDEKGMYPSLRWQEIDCDDVNIPAITNDELRITVYPNPTTGEFRVQSLELRVEGIEIFDIMGKKILSQPSLLSPETTINISHLPNGVYFLKIKTENGTVTKKVVKH